ncbi:hypothetical protein D9615_007444 [Tricholomella constricta]|uniref:P-loop containing nucleoside triphosphate hydrolase protein n=1 Tax=Tricholomella constricta TaxID=117010 RepID=A0A8H5GYA8_9AGAR|nr:hypothetical protein D9615_007444 [Tricholomella constricta]
MSTLSEPWLECQVVLILCGLVASGKTTFAEQLQHHFPKFHRCNQDDLGDRRQVEHLARNSLARGLSVCIDRTNFNAAQRSYWIEIAREFPGTSVWVIVFDTPYEGSDQRRVGLGKICAARLRTRTSHPTIKNAEQGLYVLSRFAADFEQPAPHEGYDRIISLKPIDHTSSVYSRSDIAAILRRVHDSTPVSAVSYPQSYSSQSSQGWLSSRGDSRWGFPARGYSGSRHLGVHKGRGFASTSSMNAHSPWRTSRDNAGMRGAGRLGRNTGHFRRSNPERSEHPTAAEIMIGARLEERAVPERTSTGAGTADDPLIIS